MYHSFKLHPRLAVIRSIKFYQRTLSKDHGLYKVLYPLGFCRFKPTCSEYALSAVEKYGVLRGGVKAMWRLFRCTPWTKPRYDPCE